MFLQENAQLEYYACGYRYRNPINWAIQPVCMNILLKKKENVEQDNCN